MNKNEQGAGTIRTVRDRETKVILGYQALMPRELSEPPPNCKDPNKYQEPLGQRQESWQEARTLLNAAILERIDVRKLKHGLTFGHYFQTELKARLHEAKRVYGTAERAANHLSQWRSADRLYFSKAKFYDWPPSRIGIEDLQAWFDWLRDEVTSERTGEPLSGGYIDNLSRMVSATFTRAKVLPNPMASVELDGKGQPKVIYLTLPEQRAFFGSEEIDVRDRCMAGCAMGAALRIGELISLEAVDLFVDAHDPHLIVRYGGPNHAPTKGREVKRVELFEPGLGFFRLWMREFYRGGKLVFEGPKGGYLTAWALKFSEEPEGKPSWSDVVGKTITSHVMRHSYAVAMLSGSWSYEPQSLEFVQQQLRHSSRTVTEKYYAGFEIGVWQRQVRHMTGREARPQNSDGLTAAQLLGLDPLPKAPDVQFDASIADSSVISLKKYLDGLETKRAKTSGETTQSDAWTHQALAGQAIEVLRAIADGQPLAHTAVIALAKEALAVSAPQAVEREADHG